MVKSPSFDVRVVEKPDPQHYLVKREGSPAGVDALKRRHSASSPSSPKIQAAQDGATSSPDSPTLKKHPSIMFWRLYDRFVVGRQGGPPLWGLPQTRVLPFPGLDKWLQRLSHCSLCT